MPLGDARFILQLLILAHFRLSEAVAKVRRATAWASLRRNQYVLRYVKHFLVRRRELNLEKQAILFRTQEAPARCIRQSNSSPSHLA